MNFDSISLAPYDKNWPELAETEMQVFRELFPELKFEIHHIGSTAVPGLQAKPIIDLLVGVETVADADLTIEPLEKIGYSFWRDNPNKWHYFFVKGLPQVGGTGRTHHIHIVEKTHNFFRKKILFRDYLRSNPMAARDYEILKDELSKKFPDDRDAYTEGKTDFVAEVLKRAEMDGTR